MLGKVAAISLIGMLSVVAFGAGAAENEQATHRDSSTQSPGSETEGAGASVETMRRAFDKVGCSLYGEGFALNEETGLCFKVDVFAYGFVTKDFADEDLRFEGQRLPTTESPAPTVPLLLYHKEGVRKETEGLGTSFGLAINLTVGRITDYGPFVGYLSLQPTVEGGLGSDEDSLFDDTSAFYTAEDGLKFYPGLVRQAWIRLGALQMGIQPSKFDYFRQGYSALPGYASYDETAAVSYVFRPDEDTSLSFAIEDGERRNMADGVLADYEESKVALDYVALVRRRWKNTLLHASAALHPIHDDFTGETVNGYAASLGSEIAFRSPSWFSEEKKSTIDRFMIGAAYAEGALGYLGIPGMAVDYIGRPDGSIDKSRGASLLLSYEHFWKPGLKSPLTLSAFTAEMASSGPWNLVDCQCSEFGFDVDVEGVLLEVGLQKQISAKLVIGGEATYTWSSAKGTYSFDGLDADGDKEDVSFGQLYLFGAYRF